MSLDTKVKNLIINTNMTKEQYEAVDDKSNQLFFVEDSSVVDVPAPEENQSGYLHTDGVNLTWKEIESGTDLPDQTDNAGKFLMTDGTTTSWGNALVNDTDHASSIGIGSKAKSYSAVAIGTGIQQVTNTSVTIGYKAGTNTASAVAIGSNAYAGGYGLALGSQMSASAEHSVQIGSSFTNIKNTDPNTFKVYNGVGNYEIMSADGTIPTDRYTTTPAGAGTYVPKLTIAEDGTATREWGTESSGAGGDYLPLSGGTLTGNLTITGNVKIQNEAGDGFFIQTGPYDGSAMVVGSTNSFTGEFQPRFYFSSNSIYPSTISSCNLGTSGIKWESVYAKRLNNGADIAIPTTGGTMVVATPPTDNGTYVLKATVVDGVVTTEWVSEA